MVIVRRECARHQRGWAAGRACPADTRTGRRVRSQRRRWGQSTLPRSPSGEIMSAAGSDRARSPRAATTSPSAVAPGGVMSPRKAALVPGSSRGIRAAIATRLAADGCGVLVNYRTDRSAAEKVVAAIAADGGRAVAVQADVADTGQLRGLFDAAGEHLGRLGVVVSNAGIGLTVPIAEATDADFGTVFAMNTRAVFVALREAAAPAGRRRADHRHLSRRPAAPPGWRLYAAARRPRMHWSGRRRRSWACGRSPSTACCLERPAPTCGLVVPRASGPTARGSVLRRRRRAHARERASSSHRVHVGASGDVAGEGGHLRRGRELACTGPGSPSKSPVRTEAVHPPAMHSLDQRGRALVRTGRLGARYRSGSIGRGCSSPSRRADQDGPALGPSGDGVRPVPPQGVDRVGAGESLE